MNNELCILDYLKDKNIKINLSSLLTKEEELDFIKNDLYKFLKENVFSGIYHDEEKINVFLNILVTNFKLNIQNGKYSYDYESLYKSLFMINYSNKKLNLSNPHEIDSDIKEILNKQKNKIKDFNNGYNSRYKSEFYKKIYGYVSSFELYMLIGQENFIVNYYIRQVGMKELINNLYVLISIYESFISLDFNDILTKISNMEFNINNLPFYDNKLYIDYYVINSLLNDFKSEKNISFSLLFELYKYLYNKRNNNSTIMVDGKRINLYTKYYNELSYYISNLENGNKIKKLLGFKYYDVIDFISDDINENINYYKDILNKKVKKEENSNSNYSNKNELIKIDINDEIKQINEDIKSAKSEKEKRLLQYKLNKLLFFENEFKATKIIKATDTFENYYGYIFGDKIILDSYSTDAYKEYGNAIYITKEKDYDRLKTYSKDKIRKECLNDVFIIIHDINGMWKNKLFEILNIKNNKDNINKKIIKHDFLAIDEKKRKRKRLEFNKENFDKLYKTNNKNYTRKDYVAEYTKERAAIYNEEKKEYCCEICGEKFSHSKYVDSHHIIPLSEDGPDNIYNTICICPNCHRAIHDDEKIWTVYNQYLLLEKVENHLKKDNPELLDKFYELFFKYTYEYNNIIDYDEKKKYYDEHKDELDRDFLNYYIYKKKVV